MKQVYLQFAELKKRKNGEYIIIYISGEAGKWASTSKYEEGLK
jgi:hypothetical protein